MACTLVTGGAAGLGKAICESLAVAKEKVIVHYRKSRQQALAVAEKCQQQGVDAYVVHGDFSHVEGVEGLISQIADQGLEVKNLVNNVGLFLAASPLATSFDEWQQLFHVNLHAPFLLCQRLSSQIIASRGSIVNIGSAGIMSSKADDKYTAYSISKAALYLYTKGLAKQLSSQGVRVNMVSPGEMEHSVTVNENLARLPMKRAATCQEVVRVVQFLLDPASSYITGQNIEVSGGFAL